MPRVPKQPSRPAVRRDAAPAVAPGKDPSCSPTIAPRVVWYSRTPARASWLSSEQQSHVDGVPELSASAAILLDAASFLHESELAVEGDRGGVVDEDAEAQLVQT